jgi:hypothetical protein
LTSVASQESYSTLPGEVSFSPLQDTYEGWSSPQSQAVPDTCPSGYHTHGLPIHNPGEHQDWFSGYPIHGLPIQNPGYHPECPTPETPFSAQPGEDNDYKLPPHILENMDNSQLSAGNGCYFDPTPLIQFRVNTLERWHQILNEEKVEQNGKLKAQGEEIEKNCRKW